MRADARAFVGAQKGGGSGAKARRDSATPRAAAKSKKARALAHAQRCTHTLTRAAAPQDKAFDSDDDE
jgi:hypothetical protein